MSELPFDVLRNTCPNCGHVEDIDMDEMVEQVTTLLEDGKADFNIVELLSP